MDNSEEAREHKALRDACERLIDNEDFKKFLQVVVGYREQSIIDSQDPDVLSNNGRTQFEVGRGRGYQDVLTAAKFTVMSLDQYVKPNR